MEILKKVRWLGHASFRIEGEKTVYIDPWKLKENQPAADLVLVTHSHYDHCSPGDIEKIQRPGTAIVTVSDCASQLSGDVRTVSPGGKVTVQGIEVEAVPAYNMDKQFHPKANGWVGFIVTVDGTRIYHTGDTDLIPEMEKVKADLVLLPIGGTYTMNASEAAQAVEQIKPKTVIPMHYGDIVGSAADVERFKPLCNVPIEVLEAL